MKDLPRLERETDVARFDGHASLGPVIEMDKLNVSNGLTDLIETFDQDRDLNQLLEWADVHAVELDGLSAAPTRLDDVFRALNSTPTPT